MKMKSWLSVEGQRIVISIVVFKLLIDVLLSQMILGMCYAHSEQNEALVEQQVKTSLEESR